ncbi:MAG: quinolinate synthase [Thermovibrio sp.]|nr:MAG: quinolinate synthase [Thermovibrio sp.]
MEIKERIRALKEEKNAVILAHYYVDGLIQDVADFVGDSLELARKAREVEGEIIVFCGVYFMAETAKILNPDRKVLIPYYKAGCLMADMAIAEEIEEFKRENPDYAVVTYVNSSADVKAVSDICCTSANAVKIVESLEEEKILFVPDKNLGSYVAEKVSNKEIRVWSGYCPVHHKLTLEEVERKRRENPGAPLVVHPECREEVRRVADFIGSTSQIVKFVEKTDAEKVIIGTEMGTIHQLRKMRPEIEFIPAYSEFICDQMKMITPERLLKSLEREQFEVFVDPEVSRRAERALLRMLEVK